MRSFSSAKLLLFALVMLFIPFTSSAQVAIAITIAPPALPVYEQPLCPGAGYIFVPGYWAYNYDIDDYFWVPGTWVLAPEVGFLWTPPYWGWAGDQFVFYDGYWGPVVGFYGGIVYGFGYFGEGYGGGRWENGQFFYNRAVNNINVTNIRNVYNDTTVVTNTVTRVSYNGGNGGINARPTPQQQAAAHERHAGPVAAQTRQVQEARGNSRLRASVNQGKPSVAATPKPGAFNDRAVVSAKAAGGPYRPTQNRAGGGQMERGASSPNAGTNAPRPGAIVHPRDIPPREAAARPSAGNSQRDRKLEQQQQKLQAQQERQRQKLQGNQDREHQRMQQHAADQARSQQLEQRHAQQTQRLQEKQSQQWQKMQEKQRPPSEKRPGPPR